MPVEITVNITPVEITLEILDKVFAEGLPAFYSDSFKQSELEYGIILLAREALEARAKAARIKRGVAMISEPA